MHQLVLDHVAVLRDGSIGRDDNTPLKELEESSHPLGDEPADGVGLLEVKVGTVKNERNAMAE